MFCGIFLTQFGIFLQPGNSALNRIFCIPNELQLVSCPENSLLIMLMDFYKITLGNSVCSHACTCSFWKEN